MPLLAAIGVASLVSEYGEGVLGRQLDRLLAEGFLAEAYSFWGAAAAPALGPGGAAAAAVRARAARARGAVWVACGVRGGGLALAVARVKTLPPPRNSAIGPPIPIPILINTATINPKQRPQTPQRHHDSPRAPSRT